jgi:hypothetical protein
MCDCQCNKKLEEVRDAAINAKAEIKRMTDRHGPYWGKIEALNFMRDLLYEILPVGNDCSCDAMQKLADTAGYLDKINFFAATLGANEATFQFFLNLRKIIWGMELAPKQTIATV